MEGLGFKELKQHPFFSGGGGGRRGWGLFRGSLSLGVLVWALFLSKHPGLDITGRVLRGQKCLGFAWAPVRFRV